MPMRVRRTDEEELPPDVELVWFRRGYAWGAVSIGIFIWGCASGAWDACWRALFGG